MSPAAVATATSGGVPALYKPAPLEIDRDDVQIPGVKFGHPQSEICQDNDIKLGVIYSSTSKDDPDPQILWDPAKTKMKADGTVDAESNPGLLFHVLGMYKGKSMKDGDDFNTWAFNDPDAHPNADTTYNYQLALVDGDTDLPYKMTLSRTKTPAARTINTTLVKNADRGPVHEIAFRMTTINRKKDGVGSWTVPQVRKVDATPEGIAAAARLAEMIGDSPAPAPTTKSDAPAI